MTGILIINLGSTITLQMWQGCADVYQSIGYIYTALIVKNNVNHNWMKHIWESASFRHIVDASREEELFKERLWMCETVNVVSRGMQVGYKGGYNSTTNLFILYSGLSSTTNGFCKNIAQMQWTCSAIEDANLGLTSQRLFTWHTHKKLLLFLHNHFFFFCF